MNSKQMLVLLVATTISAEISASCASRAGIAAQYADEPMFELTSCIAAQEYLSTNEYFLKAVAENERFADYMERVGIRDSSQAITVRPRNSAAVAFMFNAEEAVWLYDGNCEDVPLNSDVELEIRQGCSDTGYSFITFFDDVGILKIRPAQAG